MNGNSNGVETPKQKIKKNSEEDTKVSGVYLVKSWEDFLKKQAKSWK